MSFSLDEMEAIFTAAIALPESERESYIQDKCAGRPALLEEVRSLILSDQKSGDVLELPATEQFFGSADVAGEFSQGDMIGNYRLLQQIGTGGMGVVFMAQQLQPIKRKVALKIIKLGMDTRNVIARFESERQALAMMDHPSITRVLDAGSTEAGRPYFVMELVYGKSIKKYCNSKKLSLRKRIELFIQVCLAVHHAHQKGIIHRDIKPSNIMVASQDGTPVPKVIDFGIAKATEHDLTDKTCFTSFGDMIGTVDYMSPEQAEVSSQDIDTRSDIYSLGVVLYELLTGTTPYKNLRKLALPEIRKTIKSVEPERPSTRAMAMDDTAEEAVDFGKEMTAAERRSLQGELDWVILKCLEKDRRRRYDSAAELANDLQRFLNGEPVEAAAPSIWYRTKKFVQKNKGYAAVAACFVGMLICVSVCTSVMAYQSSVDARKVREANQLAQKRLQELNDAQEKLKKVLEQETKAKKEAVEKGQELLVAKRQLQEFLTWKNALGAEIFAEVEQFAPAEKEKAKRFMVLADQFKNTKLDFAKGRMIHPSVPVHSELGPRMIEVQSSIFSNNSAQTADTEMIVTTHNGKRTTISRSSPRQPTFRKQPSGAQPFFVGQVDFGPKFLKEDVGFQLRLLNQKEQTFGRNDVSVYITQHNVGRLFQKQKNLAEAKAQLYRAFDNIKASQEMMHLVHPEDGVKIMLGVQLDLLELEIEDQNFTKAMEIVDGIDYSKFETEDVNLPLSKLAELRKTILRKTGRRLKKEKNGN